MYKFTAISANNTTSIYKGVEYIPEILALFSDYQNYLLDDYYSKDNIHQMNEILDLINNCYPYFFAILKETKNSEDQLMGFVYLDDWKGNKSKLHACSLTTCFKKEFWGDEVREVAKQFIKWVFDDIKVEKIKAEVFSHNRNVIRLLQTLGFTQEGLLIHESVKNGKRLDVRLFRLLKKEFIPNEFVFN